MTAAKERPTPLAKLAVMQLAAGGSAGLERCFNGLFF